MTSVAMLSRAVGPPWADGSINTHVAWARALPDVEFRWFASAAWRPTEPNFRATRLGATDNSWVSSPAAGKKKCARSSQ